MIVVYILFFMSLIIIILHAYVYKFAPNPENLLIKGDTNEILDLADNGDLVFFSGNTFGEKSIKWYHSSHWSHCGIIIKDFDGENKGPLVPYILESDLGQGYKDGPRVMRLKDKFERWKGHNNVGWRRFIGKRPSKYDLLRLSQMYIHLEFDKSLMAWFFADDTKSLGYEYFKDDDKIFCSELVADILQKLNILSKTHHPSWYTPENFASGKGIDLKNGLFSSLEVFKNVQTKSSSS